MQFLWLPLNKRHKRGDSNIRSVLFIAVVIILLVAFLGQFIRDYSYGYSSVQPIESPLQREPVQQEQTQSNQVSPSNPVSPSAQVLAGTAAGVNIGNQPYAIQVEPQSVPTGLPTDPVRVGTSGRSVEVSAQNPVFDDNSFLIQGDIQVVEARLIDPIVICCLYGQGRTIRLAGIDEDVWRQELVDDFLQSAIGHAQRYYNGKMLFEVVSSEYDAFGNVYGYLYIPYENGLWWHPSYQERFYQVNLQMVRQGIAQYKPNQDYLYKHLFIEAENVAQRDYLGMWR